MKWEKHPAAIGVFIKKIVTQREFGEESPSTLFVKIPAGIEIPEHVHAGSEDILFFLDGAGTMWIENVGEFPVARGLIVRVPRNTKHKIYGVKEDILIYDIFSPGTM